MVLVVIIVAVGIMTEDKDKPGKEVRLQPAKVQAVVEDGYGWIKLGPSEKLALARRVVRAVAKKDDPAVARELVAGLDTFYKGDDKNILSRPFSESAVTILMLMGSKKGATQ